jgi:hypothetical protein
MDEPDSKRHRSGPGILVAAAIAAVLLPFLPLLIAVVEHATFGSRHVEDFFQRVGLHDLLGRLYEFLFRLFGRP